VQCNIKGFSVGTSLKPCSAMVFSEFDSEKGQNPFPELRSSFCGQVIITCPVEAERHDDCIFYNRANRSEKSHLPAPKKELAQGRARVLPGKSGQ